ncbi:MAG: NUDIX hydrolase [Thermomicrobiales bacterium]|jgi:8-oxo-dGTP pyrophosphatase MutT (NUDIX family)
MSYIERLRQYVGHQRLISPAVRKIIRDAEGQILWQQRGDTGKWGLPAGGVELDESVREALRREIFEETGLTVVRAVPFGIYSDPRYSHAYLNGDEVQPFTLAFHVEEWTGTLVADGQESLQLAFFAPDQLPPAEQLHPPHRRTAQDFLQFLATGQFIVD